MADNRNQLIALVKARGPVLPSQLTKELNTSTMFVSAMLSELVDKKIIRISRGKVGGGPVYYAEGQETKLPALIYPYFHEKEKKAFDMLKESGLIRDKDLQPVFRAAMTQIKDFAVPLEVSRKDGSNAEIFWKFFQVSDAEAAKRINEELAAELGNQKKTKSQQKKRKNQPSKAKQKKRKAKKLTKKASKTSSVKRKQKKSKKKKK